MKILIADDERYNRVILGKILAPYGNFDLAINGKEAVEAFELALLDGEPYDLVCLDIMMPEMDGHEALKKIRKLEAENGLQGSKETAIFMVTALDTEKHVVEAFFHGGCTDYLVKPITREKIIEKLKQYGLNTL